jgi:hypothetical protein
MGGWMSGEAASTWRASLETSGPSRSLKSLCSFRPRAGPRDHAVVDASHGGSGVLMIMGSGVVSDGQVRLDSAAATANPSTVARPAMLPAFSRASGTIESTSITSSAPAANPSIPA